MGSREKLFSYGAKSLFALSLCLNLGLMAAFVIRMRPESPHTNPSGWPASKHTSNQKLIELYKKLSLKDLVRELKNEALAEEGFLCSDIALGCLITFYHFDLDRALPTHTRAMRYIAFNDVQTKQQKTLPLFTDLSVGEKEALFHFATAHKWPLDSLGLFLELKKIKASAKKIADTSLKNAFFRTGEFSGIKRALDSLDVKGQSKHTITYEELLGVLLEGKWEDVLLLRQQITKAFSDNEVAQAFFAFIIETKGDQASELFLKVSMPIALKRLSDEEVIQLMRVFRTLSKAKVLFATRLLFSPRSDEVHYLAAKLVSIAANKPLPNPFDRHEALKMLFPEIQKSSSEPKKSQGTGS